MNPPIERYNEAISISSAFDKYFIQQSRDHNYLEKIHKNDTFYTKYINILELNDMQPLRLGGFRIDFVVSDNQLKQSNIQVSEPTTSDIQQLLHEYKQQTMTHSSLRILRIVSDTVPVPPPTEDTVYMTYKDAMLSLKFTYTLASAKAKLEKERQLTEAHYASLNNDSENELEDTTPFKVDVPPPCVIMYESYEIPLIMFADDVHPSTEEEWAWRETIERSLAVKFPVVEQYVACSRLVQAEIFNRADRFLSFDETRAIKKTQRENVPYITPIIQQIRKHPHEYELISTERVYRDQDLINKLNELQLSTYSQYVIARRSPNEQYPFSIYTSHVSNDTDIITRSIKNEVN